MTDVHLGYEVGTGAPVTIPIAHIAVTGQTQASGKTTTLEALVARSSATALTFITKRGESSFATGRRVTPYFHDRADWQFVTSILDATLQEKNKFLRPWIMKICRTTRTLADVQARVRDALTTAKGLNEGVYTQLDAYLDLIVPEIERAHLAEKLDLAPGINVMDVSGFATPMQMLFVQSALDWINAHHRNTVVVIPEAWEFVPEGKGSPVKASAIALARKGAALKNFIWLDSQDMAGVDKTILRGCTVWLIGVQREANEIKRNLANIPAGISRPPAAEIALLERGQFFACFGRIVAKVYVQPAWMKAERAIAIARDIAGVHEKILADEREDNQVDKMEAEALRAENERLKNEIAGLKVQVERLLAEGKSDASVSFDKRSAAQRHAAANSKDTATALQEGLDMDAIYAEVKRRAAADPGILALLRQQPELKVTVERRTIEASDATLYGRLACLIADGFFDEARAGNAAFVELQRRGQSTAKPNVYRELDKLTLQGFLTKEDGGYLAVKGMKINIVERRVA